jgi:hypothetical protein
VLTLTQVCEQHDLTIRELERIVVRARVFPVDLAKASDPVDDPLGLLENAELKSRWDTLDFGIESHFGTGNEAHGDVGLTHRAKSPRRGIPKFSRYQLVSNFRRPGLNTV